MTYSPYSVEKEHRLLRRLGYQIATPHPEKVETASAVVSVELLRPAVPVQAYVFPPPFGVLPSKKAPSGVVSIIRPVA
jgi:hypothetical protein